MSVILFFLVGALTVPALSHAEDPMRQHGAIEHMSPYGSYCPHMQWGPYGVKKPVKTVDEAQKVVETYLADHTQRTHVGEIEEKKLYFVVEILDANDRIVDMVIVDKRVGRIRSIY